LIYGFNGYGTGVVPLLSNGLASADWFLATLAKADVRLIPVLCLYLPEDSFSFPVAELFHRITCPSRLFCL
jgi:hypothetical protein